ncbi:MULTISPECIES: hypothetical protein [Thalassospira]|jgi:putative copper export protein|uniref:DUF3098 domain-containing protein n=1 Tax=Thalassospira xiamenensis TaxID=220697 RepID=A0ABR5Y120_9PROT|nr:MULTISPECIES: hypothetical protein [Thalassospira]KZD03299.1 hypothetical protein AUP40_17865 [Thalassospira xiamenensis]KZD07716.1 hypothetical protein AUP45_18280 [Thalassospira xiamenensis]MAB32885.1 hypothetical protein [Thalassospira sp.]MCD1592896.1 hypothetical protein [Thalassospira xiamenensis]MDM7974824.1 hypothetical protein [Thalassospira xiamenensis]|tara:strand:- start:3 stop:254 length:252 start_codon:yes stop_codon:yes gene_type:complete
MSADKGQPTNPEHPAKKSLPNGHYFKIMGYLLTAAWVGYILAISGGDTTHPMFDYIFVVPLAFWIGGMIIGKILRARSGADRP